MEIYGAWAMPVLVGRLIFIDACMAQAIKTAMKFLPLLGKRLKDVDVIDILESNNMKVVYDFDRSKENIPDRYWAAAKNDGFQFGFDADQTLDLTFLYVIADEGFTPIKSSECDVFYFKSPAEVEAHGLENKIKIAKGQAILLGIQRQWVRLDYDKHSVHYEFRSDELARITIKRIIFQKGK